MRSDLNGVNLKNIFLFFKEFLLTRRFAVGDIRKNANAKRLLNGVPSGHPSVILKSLFPLVQSVYTKIFLFFFLNFLIMFIQIFVHLTAFVYQIKD